MAEKSAAPSLDHEGFLELHYYSGGLRYQPIGTGGRRLDWAPPADWVGFRDEFKLADGDCVVEFVRYQFNESQITWLAVFNKSVDEVFGDRGNHSGAGIWLRDFDIADASEVLEALRQFSRAAGAEQVATLDQDAAAFVQNFLPKYIVDGRSLPESLAGWPFSSTQLPETSLFVSKTGSDPFAWLDVAAQIIRMSRLRNLTEHRSRALILIRAAEVGVVDQSHQRLLAFAHLVPELVDVLPIAFGAVAGEVQTLSGELTNLRSDLQEKERDLSFCNEEKTRSESRLREIEDTGGEASHRLSILSLSEKLDSVVWSMRRIEDKLEPNVGLGLAIHPEPYRPSNPEPYRPSNPEPYRPRTAPPSNVARAKVGNEVRRNIQNSSTARSDNADHFWYLFVALALLIAALVGVLLYKFL